MIWISHIEDLQYYRQPKGVPCYCEFLVYPQDLQLQAHLSPIAGIESLTIYIYTPDGVTNLGDITSYFEYYFATNPVTGQRFFNARLKTFAPLMCAHPCFILRAVASDVFDKYTERYCQASCCDIPRDVSIRQAGLSDPAPLVSGQPIGDPIGQEPPPPPIPATDCGEPLVRLTTWFDCYDNFTGEYYGNAGGWAFRKISNFKGKLAERPRAIERQTSYNCTLHRSESYKPWVLTGFEYFPPWKMREIENQLHANHISVTDFIKPEQELAYAGGTPFSQVSTCIEMFRFNTTLQECTQRQLFGCNEPCNNDGSLFALPDDYIEGEGLYSENGLLIGRSYEDLLIWFRNQDGITSVTDLTEQYSSPATSPLECFPQGAFYVEGNGLIPTFFYYNSKTPGNRVYGIPGTNPELLCNGNTCAMPVLGSYEVAKGGCSTPELGSYEVSESTPTELAITDYGAWVQNDDETDAGLSVNTVTFRLKTINDTITGIENTLFAGEILGSITAAGRPSVPRWIDIDADTAVSIDTNGVIRYYGYGITNETDTTITIPFVNYVL